MDESLSPKDFGELNNIEKNSIFCFESPSPIGQEAQIRILSIVSNTIHDEERYSSQFSVKTVQREGDSGYRHEC